MANKINNVLSISAKRNLFKDILEKICNKDGNLDLKKIIPVPIENPNPIIYQGDKNLSPLSENDPKWYQKNWYQWNLDNWGTIRIDSGRAHSMEFLNDYESCILNFTTDIDAINTEVVRKISELLQCEVTLEVDDWAANQSGVIQAQNGQIDDELWESAYEDCKIDFKSFEEDKSFQNEIWDDFTYGFCENYEFGAKGNRIEGDAYFGNTLNTHNVGLNLILNAQKSFISLKDLFLEQVGIAFPYNNGAPDDSDESLTKWRNHNKEPLKYSASDCILSFGKLINRVFECINEFAESRLVDEYLSKTEKINEFKHYTKIYNELNEWRHSSRGRSFFENLIRKTTEQTKKMIHNLEKEYASRMKEADKKFEPKNENERNR